MSAIRFPLSTLALVGFVTLFLELACIRWFSAQVVFLHYFSNLVWVAAFIGLSLGCLAAKSATDWLSRFPRLFCYSVTLAGLFYATLAATGGVQLSLGAGTSAQNIFFGIQDQQPDVARFIIPLEAALSIIFVLVALLFIGLGQILARAMSECANPLRGYVANIFGSLAGIVAFIGCSHFQLPATLWFLCAVGIVAYLMREAGGFRREHLVFSVLALLLVAALEHPWKKGVHLLWSPYYFVEFVEETRAINVDHIGHQTMHPFESGGAGYSLVHLLRRDSGADPFKSALVIGAGSGNDVAHAVLNGVAKVDAVEIDPAIQRLGERFHPDAPYSSPVVTPIINDGRNALQRAPAGHYDLVVYALVDSLLSSSSFTGVRLESFLFTREAFREVRRVLGDDGVFVAYNVFRQGWIVHRISQMLEAVFGKAPLILAVPHIEEIAPNTVLDNLTVIIAGNTAAIEKAFKDFDHFLLRPLPRSAATENGFTAEGTTPLAGELLLKPVRLTDVRALAPASDQWPQLYLKEPSIPLRPYLTLLAVLFVVTGVLFISVVPTGARLSGGNPRMFFLGAGFLLLETRAVTQLQLLFGSVWLVTSLVFAGILLLILVANLLALKYRFSVPLLYILLVLSLVASWFTPFHWFSTQNYPAVKLLAVILVLLPVPFGTLIFSETLRRSASVPADLAVNFVGACVGSALEILVMLVGLQGLLPMAALIYIASIFQKRVRVPAVAL